MRLPVALGPLCTSLVFLACHALHMAAYCINSPPSLLPLNSGSSASSSSSSLSSSSSSSASQRSNSNSKSNSHKKQAYHPSLRISASSSSSSRWLGRYARGGGNNDDTAAVAPEASSSSVSTRGHGSPLYHHPPSSNHQHKNRFAFWIESPRRFLKQCFSLRPTRHHHGAEGGSSDSSNSSSNELHGSVRSAATRLYSTRERVHISRFDDKVRLFCRHSY